MVVARTVVLDGVAIWSMQPGGMWWCMLVTTTGLGGAPEGDELGREQGTGLKGVTVPPAAPLRAYEAYLHSGRL